MLCLSRVTLAKPTIKASDLLDASRLCLADCKTNMLHGKICRRLLVTSVYPSHV